MGRVHEICRCCAVRQECIFAEVGEERLLGRARWVRYARRDMVFHQGEPAIGLYVIYRGTVMLFKSTRQGQRHIFDLIGPAGILGEEALVPHSSYTLSAQALTPAQLLFIDRSAIQHLWDTEASVRQRLWERLLLRLSHIEDLLLDMRSLNAGERVTRLLLRLAAEHGFAQSQGWIEVDLGLTQAELGEMVGLSREAVNKHLNGLKERGALHVTPRRILINPSTLGIAQHTLSENGFAAVANPLMNAEVRHHG